MTAAASTANGNRNNDSGKGKNNSANKIRNDANNYDDNDDYIVAEVAEQEGEEQDVPAVAAVVVEGEGEESKKAQKIGLEIAELRKQLASAKEAAEGNLNRLRYLMADFDNYRKQTEKQVAARTESIKAELLLKFLNIRDDYMRAIEGARQKSEPAVIQGLEGILRNIDSLLSSEGVVPIEAVGTPFDPNIHDAIAFSSKDSNIPENTVTAEIRRGYMLNGKVLRPSMVEIARKIVKNNDTANNGSTQGEN
jgi:molecular chaperone GrpE